MSATTDLLLDAAETRMRSSGFHGVSFRDLAADLGIKSASVHYHFPRKEDLGAAVIKRYHQRVMDNVEALIAQGMAPLAAYRATYRAALEQGGQACLCGVMGAEMHGLPAPVQAEVERFMTANTDWLEAVYRNRGETAPRDRALATLATLQGAMLLAVSLGDLAVFDRVAEGIAP